MNDHYDRILPVLVYGTLREGFGNDVIAYSAGGVKTGETTLDGYSMWMPGHKFFPYVTLGEGSITVDVIEPPAHPAMARKMIADLDVLENFNPRRPLNHYVRTAVEFTDPNTGETREGWIYLTHAQNIVHGGMSPIASGDWATVETRVAEREAAMFES